MIIKKIRGFTIVEMLIVAPIVILVIGIFITAVVNMTGDVLATRASNVLSYNIQDALNRIEQDVDSSGGYLATNNITLTSPQGYDDITASFKNVGANGTMLILNTYATTSSPLNSTSIVYTPSPNLCGSNLVSQNPPVMMNIIYFVKNGTLWRRVVAPSNYMTIGCSVPWQQPSCAPGFTTPSFCKTQDTRLVDGIVSGTGFGVGYYTSASSTIANSTASDSGQSDSARQAALQSTNTASVTINATSTVAGRNISQSGTMRAISPNNNTTTTPVAKTVEVLVVAGGGGGGGFGGGGGGGYQYDATHSVSAGPFSVTVGDGGGGAASGNVHGTNGSNSIFDTIMATGGGGGGAFDNTNLNGADGGSGGGAGTDGGGNGYTSGAVGLGTSGQGHDGGLAVNSATASGGGGGAGAVGGAGVTTTGGNGGSGTANSISGSSVTYAGGGGASGQFGAGTGGSGGGGNGGINSGGNRTAGTANTGGGGGGGYNTTGMAGGSGVVIISYPTNSLNVNVTGTVATTTSNGNTIQTFTGNGTFTVN